MENSLINKRLLKETYDKNAGQIQEVKKKMRMYIRFLSHDYKYTVKD